MNANELADKLDEAADDLESENIFAWEERAAATMLRQKQAEIEALKAHPVKELTDEEILDIWYEMEDSSNEWTRYVTFARAILRKAQEK